MINLTIDGLNVTVAEGTTVYQAARQLGLELPIFCYMDRMPPFGACRVCLVEVEKMPRLQTSCTLVATEGMVVKTQSQIAAEGRKDILEFLLLNHPLDCPICDRGGECPLQEHAFAHGPGESRFFEEKRHFTKPLPMSPVLMLDRERCIICARCTRFGDLVAGDNALEFVERGFKTVVGTQNDETVESKFIGNTIMICPVGALTSQVYRFRARPWDNEPTDTTCTLCPVGCSMILDSRDGEIMRTRSKENRAVNDVWMCDKGWFGYEFTYHQDRLLNPLIRKNGSLQESSWEEAISLIAKNIQEAKPNGKLAALGGNPLTVEENYLLQKLMRDICGVNHVDNRVGMSVQTDNIPLGMQQSIGECEALSFAILLGLDLTEEFPVIWLRLKQSLNCGGKAFYYGHFATEIARHLNDNVVHTPGKELEILDQCAKLLSTLAGKGKGAVFVGRQYLNMPNRAEILSKIATLCAKSNVSLNVMEGSGNSFGALLGGMQPDRGPLNQKIDNPGMNAIQILEKAAQDSWDFLYVVGANPAVKYPSKIWEQVRRNTKCLVVQDLFLTETASKADIVLPALSFTEKAGSFINVEGRVQRLLPGKMIPENLYSDGEIFTLLTQKLGSHLYFDQHFLEALTPNSVIKIQPDTQSKTINSKTVPTSNGLLATFSKVLFDHGVRMKHDPKLIQLSKEPKARIHPNEGNKRNIKDGSKVNLSANGNTIVALIKFDEGVAENTIVLPLGFAELPVQEFGMQLYNGMSIEVIQTR